ncbi:hypothetical protein M4D57_18745 [Brevibacillus borstelensis]|uniref:hypothetical protein n=1 Tax=Brevibacillus borstelensis TaxID=45462 RepID=UPI000469C867|nr:hypothetical protein [Brevibacillus borstelensis]MCM3560608.1 hypothetical protein [Brevibacillus borstelensis]
MQAGREWEPGELDVLVAETLGWVFSERHETWSHNAIYKGELPKFSTTWEGMGVLVEEARKQGINIDILTREHGYAAVWGKRWADNVVSKSAPHAVSIGFLKARGIEVTA